VYFYLLFHSSILLGSVLDSQRRILLSDIVNSKRRLQQKVKDVGAEYDLINDLGFNLCVVP